MPDQGFDELSNRSTHFTTNLPKTHPKIPANPHHCSGSTPIAFNRASSTTDTRIINILGCLKAWMPAYLHPIDLG
ncbi:MAG: hypothetical protein KME19_06820 [Microcoleus vaginatus WJT46-NPBG5]|nr:hypothetical protein [Microcoleus vaginatus WJT46-NPBG5]